MRPPGHILTRPDKIIDYLNAGREGFVTKYNDRLSVQIDIATLPKITKEEAINWRNDNFIYMVLQGDERLEQALAANIDDFEDFINYRINDRTALLLAASENHHKIVEALLHSPRIDAHVQNEKGETALMLAARHGHAKVVAVMLESNKINVNAQDHEGKTALILAIEEGNIDVVLVMLATKKMDATALNTPDNEGNTPFIVAIKYGNMEIINALLASPHIQDNLPVNRSTSQFGEDNSVIQDQDIDPKENPEYSASSSSLSRTTKSGIGFVTTLGIGAGVGALLGTFVFPGIGTAIGAAIGAGFGASAGFLGIGFGGIFTKNTKIGAGLLTIGAAGAGALLGTFVFPGIGTLVGAAVGSGIGIVSAVLTNMGIGIKEIFTKKKQIEPSNEKVYQDEEVSQNPRSSFSSIHSILTRNPERRATISEESDKVLEKEVTKEKPVTPTRTIETAQPQSDELSDKPNTDDPQAHKSTNFGIH
jgi:hypothetical protein